MTSGRYACMDPMVLATTAQVRTPLHDRLPNAAKPQKNCPWSYIYVQRDIFIFIILYLNSTVRISTLTKINLICNKVVNWHPCIVLFWVGRYNNLDLQCSPRLRLGEHWGSRGNKTHCFPWGQSLSAYCYTSQLKYVFSLEENVSPVIGQNFMTP